MRYKRILSFVSCLLVSACCFGCGTETLSPIDSVKAIYDLYVTRDLEGATRIGIAEDKATEVLASYDEAISETIRSSFSDSGLDVDDQTVEEICEAREQALSRMNAEYELVSEDEDSAVIRLTTTYFDETTLVTDAADKAREEAKSQGFTEKNQEEYLTSITESYTKNLIAEYEAIQPSGDTKEILVPCTIANNIWLPQDMAAFGSDLGLALAGQSSE